jgi:hypothetical protein
MKLDTRYFALAVRAIGIFVLAEAAPNALYYLVSSFGMYQQLKQSPGASIEDVLWGQGPTILYTLLRLALGVYLLRGGGVIARYCVRVCENACPACGYDLRNVSAEVCPECGCGNTLFGSLKAGVPETHAGERT